MDVVRLIEPGPLTTIQDKGRKGYQRFGMPVAGAMDLFSYRIANLLVGNNEDAAAIEFTLQGLQMEFLQDALIAVTGAETVFLQDNKPLPMWQSILVTKGSIISLGRVSQGLRGYVAISGGLDVPEVLGSSSTYLRAELGGMQGRKLIAGDILTRGRCFDIKLADFKNRRLPKALIPKFKEYEEIRVILGPQAELFASESIATFLTSDYEITLQSDRMGYRLKGPVIIHKESADIISDGIPPGAIQVPGHGQPIIMLADRPTTGGYAKIATVIARDLNKIAQLKPGNKIRFKEVALEEAYAALHDMENIMGKIEEFAIKAGPAKVYKLRIGGREYIASVEECHE